jgi:hypothetical protein
MFLAVLPAAAQISGDERLRFHLWRAVGPVTLVRAGAAAGMAQLGDSPPDWEQGMSGYSRRFASRMGEAGLQNAIELGAGAILREDPRFHRKGTGPPMGRVWHAVTSPLVYRPGQGRARPALARLGGLYGSVMIGVAAWYPDRYRATGDGVRRANIRLGTAAAVNVAREFWPEIRRLFRR